MQTVLLSVTALEDHPQNNFADLSEDKLRELAESIAEVGIIHPLIVRPTGNKEEERYQIISGHQRKRAAELLGLKELPCIVVDVSDAEAEIMLIDANLETRTLSTMETARAIRRRKELLGLRQGRRTDLIPDMMSEVNSMFNLKMTDRHMRRLDKLNDLIPALQDMVDSGKLGIAAGERLAGLPAEVQQALFDALGEDIAHTTQEEVRRLKAEVENGYLVLEILKKEYQKTTEELNQLKQEVAEREQLKREIQKLQAQKKDLEYTTEDWLNAAKRAQERAAREGAVLIDRLEGIGKPVQTAMPEIEALLEHELDEVTAVYALKWAKVLSTAGEEIQKKIKVKSPKREEKGAKK